MLTILNLTLACAMSFVFQVQINHSNVDLITVLDNKVKGLVSALPPEEEFNFDMLLHVASTPQNRPG